ncbi:MAG: Ig-like domain repeat protein [Terracidiphilus sp.]|jgi:hypothetical protein
MFDMQSISVATTRKGILAITSRVLKGSGAVAFLLLFLLAALSNANATTTLTPATVTASPTNPTYGATVTLTSVLSGWVSAAGGTVTFETSTSSTGTYVTTLVTCGSSGSATVTAAASNTCQTSALPVGTTYVKAVYATSATGYAGATSATAAAVTVTGTPTTTTLTASPTSTAQGNPVTLTAVVSPTAATGVVTFKSAVTTEGTAGVLGTCTITSGGTCNTTVLTTGWTVSTTANSLTAVYAATGNYATSTSAAKIVTIATGTATTTGVVTLGTASPIVYGTSETLSATVSAGTGTVTFLDNGTTSLGTATISSGIASLTSAALAPGTHSITAAYGGDATHDASASASATSLTVTSNTTTTLIAAATGTYGTTYSLTANVVPTSGPGTVNAGTVTFSNGSVTLGTCTIASGTCSTSTTVLPPGSYTVTASYPGALSGGVTYNLSSSAGTSVTASGATLAVSLSVTNSQGASFTTPVAQGTSVLLTAHVTPVLAASGTLNFEVGGNSIAGCNPVSLGAGGTATCLTALLPAGTDSLSAIFTQTANTSDFVSTTATGNNSVTVIATPTLVVSAAPYYYGAPVTLNVSGFPAAANGGTVNFVDEGGSQGTCILSGGTCGTPFTISTLPVANHSFMASFAGNGAAPAASTTSTNVNVVANPTIVTLASSAPYVASTDSLVLTATVTTADSITVPGGHVTFYDSNTSLGQGTVGAVTSGQATLTLSAGTLTTPGTHYLIASYGGVYSAVGVAQFGASLSRATQVLVVTGQTINFNALPASPTYGASVPLVATSVVAGTSKSTGLTVVFTGTPGACTVNGSTLTYVGAGTLNCTVTASQAGNSEYPAATPASQTVSVGQATQSISHWYNGSTVYGTPITLSAVSSSASDSTNGQPIIYTVTGGPATHGVVSGTTVTPTGAGTITITAALAGNTDYAAASAVAKTFTVYPKPLTITASSPSSVNFGAAPPTVTAGYSSFVSPDTSASLGTVSCTTNYEASSTNHPGTYSTYCYGASNPNYDITLVDGSFSVTKATPTPATLPTAATATTYAQLSTYPLTGGTATGAFGSAISGSYSWTNPAAYLSVGSSSPSVTFKPSDTTDYNTVATTININGVVPANPAVSWPTASAIPSTDTLGQSTLTGGSTNGTFAWTTPSTTFPGSGVYSENVTFTPNSANYNSITHNINVTVTKGAATITCWPTGTTISYGAKLSTSTLGFGSCSGGIEDAGDTPGTFAWTSPNTIPAAGVAVNESVTFTPTDTVNFSSQAHTTTLTVNKINPTVSVWPTATAITYPAPLNTSVLHGGSSGGTFAWTCSLTSSCASVAAGTDSESVTFTPTGATSADYNAVSQNVNVLVYQATATVSVPPTADPILLGSPLSSSGWLTPGSAVDINSNPVDGTFAWTTPATQPGVGTSAQSVTFTPTDSIDYTTTTVSVNITVNPCGYQDATHSIYATALNFFTFTDSGTTLTSPVLDAETTDESAVCAVDATAGDGTAITVAYPTITSGATASLPADSGTYGTNAAVLAYGTDTTAGHGATITIADDGHGNAGSILTNNDNSAGVFASMGGAADISNTYVTTLGNYSPALAATKQGALTITATTGSLTATTYGSNSPALATGIGGGTVSSTGGVYTSMGTESAGIHAAGAGSSITLNGDTVTTQNASAVEMNGNTSVTSTGATTLSGALGDNHGIFLYYDSTPGDSTAGASNFTMTAGSILYTCDATQNAACAPSSPSGYQNSLPTLFSVANTTGTITLTDVAVFNTTPNNDSTNGTLLTAAAIAGIPSSTGGNVTFNAEGEALVGDVIVDANSTVRLNLAADTATPAVPSSLTGTINGANSGAAAVSLTLDATSTWVVTGDSYLTSLTNSVTDNSNITCSNPGTCHVYLWQNAAWVAQPGIN